MMPQQQIEDALAISGAATAERVVLHVPITAEAVEALARHDGSCPQGGEFADVLARIPAIWDARYQGGDRPKAIFTINLNYSYALRSVERAVALIKRIEAYGLSRAGGSA